MSGTQDSGPPVATANIGPIGQISSYVDAIRTPSQHGADNGTNGEEFEGDLGQGTQLGLVDILSGGPIGDKAFQLGTQPAARIHL